VNIRIVDVFFLLTRLDQLDKLEDVTHVLNEQANLLFEWRDKIVEMLTQKLIDDSVQEENGPSPYERAVIVQAELESYMQAYQSLLVCGHSYLLISPLTCCSSIERKPLWPNVL